MIYGVAILLISCIGIIFIVVFSNLRISIKITKTSWVIPDSDLLSQIPFKEAVKILKSRYPEKENIESDPEDLENTFHRYCEEVKTKN